MTEANDSTEELSRLQRECKAMVGLLKELEKEEVEITEQNKILAREALVCGYQPHLLEPSTTKRRRVQAKKKTESSTS